eukprot:scaffold1970_cov396-Prasinococcus_capsulatus_cf.AAC.37
MPPPARCQEREIARVPVVANVAVGRRARKRGYAKRMMALCEEQAREWGYERCYLVVEANNRPAQTLYRKLEQPTPLTCAIGRKVPRVEAPHSPGCDCTQGYKKVRADRGTALQVAKGELVERSVTNVTMVKDVSGTPQAILQNIDWLGLLPRAALLAAVLGVARRSAAATTALRLLAVGLNLRAAAACVRWACSSGCAAGRDSGAVGAAAGAAAGSARRGGVVRAAMFSALWGCQHGGLQGAWHLLPQDSGAACPSVGAAAAAASSVWLARGGSAGPGVLVIVAVDAIAGAHRTVLPQLDDANHLLHPPSTPVNCAHDVLLFC